MKIFVTIIILLTGHLLFGQAASDTCLTRSQLYDMKEELYRQSDFNNDLLLKIRMLTELKKVDTLVHTRDSVAINYMDKTNVILSTIKKYYKDNCLKDSLVIHYNKYGLIYYTENWSTDCYTNPKDRLTYKNSYSRYVYDEANRIIKYVFHISTPMTRRVLFKYDSDGHRTEEIERIEDTEFWD
jgi:hypothetical protein